MCVLSLLLFLDTCSGLSGLKPFQEASLQERERFKVELQKYQAQLTPDQLQQQTMEKRQRMAKRKAIRKKRVGAPFSFSLSSVNPSV